MRRLALLALILLLVATCSSPDQPPGKGAFPPFYPDGGLFLAAIHHCRVQPLPQKISGLTGPHHLLAADLMAAALSFVTGLPFSQSKQEQFLEDVELLARRLNTSPWEILSQKQLRQPLDDPALTPLERAEAVRRLLKGWVNPRLNAALTAFQQALGRLGLKGHPRVRLQPPPVFEGPDFHLEIKFRDSPELEGLLAEIARLSAEQEFSDLTRL